MAAELTPNFSIPIPSDPLSQLDARRAWLAVDAAFLDIDSLSSPTSITIIADNDANGTGMIDLQTRNLSRLQVLNGGDINVIKQLGINTPNPTASLHITPTYADGVTVAENVIWFPTPNGNAFGFNLSQTLQGADPNDDVMMWGWNVDSSIVGEPTLRFSMERAFGSGPSNYEIHIEVITPTGGADRPWTWTIDRDTGATLVATSAASMNFTTGQLGETGKNGLTMTNSEVIFEVPNGGVRFLTDNITFETLDNGGAPAKQMRIEPFPSDSERSWLLLGDASNAVGLHNSNPGELTLFEGDGSTVGKLRVLDVFTNALDVLSGNIDLAGAGTAGAVLLSNSNYDLIISSAVGGDASFRFLAFSNDLYLENIGSGDIILRTSGATERMRLTANGNLSLGRSIQIGSPTGGDKGVGTINVAADIYKNNVAYVNPDYVLEHWATHAIVKYAHKSGAEEYRGLMPLADVEQYARKNWCLPRFGQTAGHGLFSGGDALLASLEEAYLYIFDLQSQIHKLQEGTK